MTRPKISSRPIVESLRTLPNTAGPMKNPRARSFGRPPLDEHAADGVADLSCQDDRGARNERIEPRQLIPAISRSAPPAGTPGWLASDP